MAVIERLLIAPYELRLRRAWGSARDTFDRRSGFLLRIIADGVCGFGDCAPLPGAGTETREAAHERLLSLQSRLPGTKIEHLLAGFDDVLEATPATRFALECALLDVVSQSALVPLRQHLSATAKDRIPVNAIAGPLGSLTPVDLQGYQARGFKVLKLKVGLDRPDVELDQLALLARQLPPDVGLRLDANGAWGLDEAERVIASLAGLPIESLEEPLRDPTTELLARLQSIAHFPLARDESLRGLVASLDPAMLGVRRLVLKPAVIGGLTRTLALAHAAMAAGVEVVVTSVVESAAGLWPTAQLAAATGSTIAHGLATADWLLVDLGTAPMAQQGCIELPGSPGSGFRPHA